MCGYVVERLKSLFVISVYVRRQNMHQVIVHPPTQQDILIHQSQMLHKNVERKISQSDSLAGKMFASKIQWLQRKLLEEKVQKFDV